MLTDVLDVSVLPYVVDAASGRVCETGLTPRVPDVAPGARGVAPRARRVTIRARGVTIRTKGAAPRVREVTYGPRGVLSRGRMMTPRTRRMADKLKLTTDLKAAVAEGTNLAINIRAIVRGEVGARSEKLVELGIAPPAASHPQAEAVRRAREEVAGPPPNGAEQ